MTVALDAEIAAALAPVYEAMKAIPPLMPGDWRTPGYAAPGRATDLPGLPPAYIETGQLDIFREENITYADRLGRVGVPVQLVQYPAVPHAFDTFDPAAAVSRRATARRVLGVAGPVILTATGSCR